MVAGEAGAAAAAGEPPAGEAGAAAGLDELLEPPVPAGLPPVPPSIVKGPANARSGEFPSSKASIKID